jgi:hypothetical protein
MLINAFAILYETLLRAREYRISSSLGIKVTGRSCDLNWL